MNERYRTQSLGFREIPLNSYSLAAIELLVLSESLRKLLHLSHITLATDQGEYDVTTDVAALHLFLKAILGNKLTIHLTTKPGYVFDILPDHTSSGVTIQKDSETTTPQDLLWLEFYNLISQSLATA